MMFERCRKAFVLFVSLLLSVHAGGQRVFEAAVSAGRCLPNEKHWNYIASNTVEVGAAVSWPLLLDSTLSHADRYAWGLRADWLHAATPIAGERFGIFGFVQNPLFVGRGWQASWMLEGGLSCYTRPYKATLDDLNEFVGSYLNCHIGVGLRQQWCLRGSDALCLALMFRHSSNGYLKKPNQGLNYLQVEVGYAFRTAADTMALHPLRVETLSSTLFFVSLAPGLVLQRGGGSNTRYFFTYTAQAGALYRFNAKRALGGNLDLMYSFTHHAFAEQDGKAAPFPMYAGLCGTYETAWNRLFVRLSLGAYLLKSRFVEFPVYERVGIYYRFGDALHQYAGVSFKAHYAHVDYIEWTYGIEF